MRSHVTTSAMAAGAFAFLVGAAPAGSTDGEPMPNVVVSPDCPPNGFLVDGRPCVVGPASSDPGTPAPAPSNPPSTTPTPPPPAGNEPSSTTPTAPPPADTQTAPAKQPQKKGDETEKVQPKPKPADKPARTRLGDKRVERAKPEADKRRKETRRAATPSPKTGATTGSAGLPGLTFTPPAAAAPVPDVLLDRFPIPPFLLPIYQAAAVEYDVPWQVLAAINEIETDYGRNLNVSSAGALGWMQFMPSSWKAYGVDANDDGRKDPYNPVDAIFASARYLKAAGAKDDIRQAIFAYNHADWYVQSVMLRAKLVRQLPVDLVGALTGLTEGRFPVVGRATYAKKGGGPKGIEVDAREGLPVVAVNDGLVKAIGQSKRLGRFLRLQDFYGNTYTYTHLGEVRARYATPRTLALAQLEGAKETDAEKELKDPKPAAPATAGRQTARPPADATETVTVQVKKERLFAHPARPASYREGGERQLAQVVEALPAGEQITQYLTADYPLRRRDLLLRPLRPGAQVMAGAILGDTGRKPLKLLVRPAGRGAPAVNPRPILDSWRLLESTAIYKGKALRRLGSRNPSIGQLMLMSKEALARRVLADKRIRIYECGRRDVATGAIDRRVLITMEFLAASDLHPLISALQCGHSYYTTAGTVSEHSSGNAVDIASINRTAILGHQGKGSITDVTIRRLLTLQGTMKPHQIISLMKYADADNTLSMSNHDDHIHVGFYPEGPNGGAAGPGNQVLKPKQWTRLVKRLDQIKNPKLKG